MDCYDLFLKGIEDVTLISEAAESGQLSKNMDDKVRGNALARSGYVLLCGYFEGFLRDLISEFLETINDAKVKVDKMPNHLLHSAISALLSKETPDKSVTRLRAGILTNEHLSVDAKKHSRTGGNPTVDNVEALFSALGYPNVIDTLSIQDFGVTSTFVYETQVHAQMKKSIEFTIQATPIPNADAVVADLVKLIDARWAPKKKRRKVGYVSDIEELLRRRNLIAHGEGREPIAVEDLKVATDSVKRLCTGLHSLLLNQMSEILQ